MDINHILIKGCPLCEIFLNPEENVITKLHYPEFDKIQESDFIIVDCKTCKVPMLVIRDHVTSISKELWGRILYTTRNMYGNGTRLRYKPRTIKDHWHAHIFPPKKDY